MLRKFWVRANRSEAEQTGANLFQWLEIHQTCRITAQSTLPQRVKRQEHEADHNFHLVPSSRLRGMLPSLPHTSL
jgi:hypothetical protein